MRDATVQVHQVQRLEGEVLRLRDALCPVRAVAVDLVVDPFCVPRAGAGLVEVLDREEVRVAVDASRRVGGRTDSQGRDRAGDQRSGVSGGPLGPAERRGGERRWEEDRLEGKGEGEEPEEEEED